MPSTTSAPARPARLDTSVATDESVRPMATRPRRLAAALLCTLAALPACIGNPFDTYESDYGLRVDPRRLRTIDAKDMSAMAVPVEPVPEDDEVARTVPDPFAGIERVDVTLEQCRAWTLENNLDLRVALVDPAIAQTTVDAEASVWEAIFFANARRSDTDSPTATALEGNQTRSYNFSTGVRIPMRTGGTVTVEVPVNRFETDNAFATLNPSYTSDLNLSISQPLLRNAGRRVNTFGLRIAALNQQISEAQTKLEVIRQVAAVDRTYWGLYAAENLLEVRQREYEAALEQLEAAERRFRAGAVAEIEVITAESGVADRLEAIIVAENAVRQLQRQLKRIINVPGLDVGSQVLLEAASPPDPVAYLLEPESLATAAVANRMEMLELELQIAQDIATIDFRRNQELPSFIVDYTYRINGLGGTFSDSVGVLTGNNFQDWSLGFSFETPVGNGVARAGTSEAILRRLQRLATKAAREQSIRQEVFDAIDALDAAWQRILAARQRAILDGRAFRAEQRQFELGTRTSTDVLDAAARLSDAQQAEVRALADYQIAQVDLAFATGSLLGAAKIEWAPLDQETLDPEGVYDFPLFERRTERETEPGE